MNFHNNKEAADLVSILKTEKRRGAVSGGVFGSTVKGTRRSSSDIDVYVNDPSAPYLGEVDYKTGEQSGTLFHIFKKRPGTRPGKSRFEEIQNEAETKGRKLFGR